MIPLDALMGPWTGVISIGVFVGILGIVWAIEKALAKARQR